MIKRGGRRSARRPLAAGGALNVGVYKRPHLCGVITPARSQSWGGRWVVRVTRGQTARVFARCRCVRVVEDRRRHRRVAEAAAAVISMLLVSFSELIPGVAVMAGVGPE